MLAKLIKLDLRFAYKQFLVMAAVLLGGGLVVPYLSEDIMKIGLPILFSLCMTLIPLMSIWLVVQHFQRNLFGNEGYLMFTLPVSAYQLLLSKLITTVIWFNLMVGSAFGLVVLVFRNEVPYGSLLSRLNWDVIWTTIREALHTLLIINANVIPAILAVYLGIAVSTVAVRNRKLGIAWGVAVAGAGAGFFYWTVSKLTGTQFVHLTVNGTPLVSGNQLPASVAELVNLGTAAVFAIGYFLITAYVMRRKLNLD